MRGTVPHYVHRETKKQKLKAQGDSSVASVPAWQVQSPVLKKEQKRKEAEPEYRPN